METIKAIEKRRSIRTYKDISISKEIIEDILNCGMLAPSAKNRQPWYFIVVSGEIKDKIISIMCDEVTKESIKYDNGYNNSVVSTANVIKEAPILILIFKEKDNNWIISDNLSIGACVENMCLRATELGLGTLWIRDIVYTSEQIASYLNKEDLELNCALTIGIPNQDPKPRPRKKLEEIVEWMID